MSIREAAVSVLATAAGLAAIVFERLSADTGVTDEPLVAGLAGAVTVGFAVLLFAWALPRAKSRDDGASGMALVTSVVGFFSVASAWTGLPFVLGAGGAMLGTAARRGTAEPRQRAVAGFAVGLGVGAVALACVAVAAV